MFFQQNREIKTYQNVGKTHWENPALAGYCYDDNRELLELDHFKFGKCDCDFETRSAVLMLLNMVVTS
jgi:hypothetical protein